MPACTNTCATVFLTSTSTFAGTPPRVMRPGFGNRTPSGVQHKHAAGAAQSDAPEITKMGTEMSAAYSVSIDICAGDMQQAEDENVAGMRSAGVGSCLLLEDQQIVVLARAEHRICGTRAVQHLHKTVSGCGASARCLDACAEFATHNASLSLLDMRVMHPMNETQACSSTTLPMSCTCICQGGCVSTSERPSSTHAACAAARTIRKRPKTARMTRRTTNSMDDMPGRVPFSCARGAQPQTNRAFARRARVVRTCRAKLRRMHSAVSQIAGCTMRLR